MDQQLTMAAFTELFTDDDMNTVTMRRLLKRVYRGNEGTYRAHGVTLAAATQVRFLLFKCV